MARFLHTQENTHAHTQQRTNKTALSYSRWAIQIEPHTYNAKGRTDSSEHIFLLAKDASNVMAIISSCVVTKQQMRGTVCQA